MFKAGGSKVKAGARVKVCVDRNGLILSCHVYGDDNKQFDPKDLSGQNVADTMSEGESESFIRLIRYTIETGKPTLHIHKYQPGPNDENLRKVVIRPGVTGGNDAVLLVYPYP